MSADIGGIADKIINIPEVNTHLLYTRRIEHICTIDMKPLNTSTRLTLLICQERQALEEQVQFRQKTSKGVEVEA